MSDDDRAARKAAKKAAKLAAAAAAEPAEEIEEEEDAARAAKKAAKKARKEARRRQAEAEEVEAAEEQHEDEQDQPVKKKAKRVDGSAGQAMAHGESSGNYIIHPDTAAMSSSKAEEYRTSCGITLTPPELGDKYHPITAFEQVMPSLGNHCPDVRTYIDVKKFKTPTPIQGQCWPLLLAGEDVIGIAATGSGKTLAFLIPALLKIAKSQGSGDLRRKGAKPRPQVLIMAPTRELAMQSHQVNVDIVDANTSLSYQSIQSVCIYGGVSKDAQRAGLRANPGIIVATPGRLQDLIEEGSVDLSDVKYAVLDEADRMLDEGFEPAIKKIMSYCPSGENGRQTVMFSATWPEEIRALAAKYMSPNAVRVTVGSEELSANHRVTQIVECIDAAQKDRKLMTLLEKYHKSRKNKCLLFVLYKREADNLERTLSSRGFNVVGIHGDKSQEARTAALEEFKSGRIPLLIATDVAARGLDIPQVEYVINYSFPLTVEDYVHRIGRTGRAGATGISHTFFTDFDKGLAGALVGVLQDANQEVPQEIYKYPMVTKKKQSKLYGDFGPKADLAGKKATKITFD